MHCNERDSGKRRFICVQIPEVAGQGYSNICEIGEERIRRAGARILELIQQDNTQPELGGTTKPLPDVGFRVLSLDSSNCEEIENESNEIVLFTDTIKPDRSNEDVIVEAMLKWGLDLSLPIERIELDGYQCWSIAKGELICCMDEGLTVPVLERIASLEDRPRRVLMRDSILTDTLKLNAEAIFARAAANGDEIELRTV